MSEASKSRSSNQSDSLVLIFSVAKREEGAAERRLRGGFEVENPPLSSVDDFLAVVSPDLSADG